MQQTFHAERLASGVRATGGGWSIEPVSLSHALRPMLANGDVGKVVVLKVAVSQSACANESSPLDLVATARAPSIDPGSVVL